MLWKRKLQIHWIILAKQNPKGLLRNGDQFNIYFHRKNISILILYTIFMYIFDHYMQGGGGGGVGLVQGRTWIHIISRWNFSMCEKVIYCTCM